MFSRRTLAAILALTQMTTAVPAGVFSRETGVSALFAVPSAAAEGFVGEDLGLDLYRKVDQGIGKLKTMLVEKRIPGNAKKLNERIGKQCRGSAEMGPPAPVNCLDEGKDFTLEELDAIESGSAAPILSRLAPDVSPAADDIPKIVNAAKAYVGMLKSEAGDQTATFGRIGSIGLFADGSIENSSYDLMKDLENIHSIVFAKEIPYGGMPNVAAAMAMDFAQMKHFVNGDRYDDLPYDPGIDFRPPVKIGGGTLKATFSASGLTSSAYCADGTDVKGIDSSLAFDIASQLQYGSNPGSAGSAEDLAAPAPAPIPPSGSKGSSGGGSESLVDKYPCMLFFCIKTDFLMYESLLLGGGNNFSVESVLDQNFKIVNEFAGSSFIQAQHTNNFFELLLKNLNLPSLAHLGVIVTTLPPPILNINGGDSPRGEPKTSSEEKEFKEVTAGTFKDFGIRYDKQNELDDSQVDHGISNTQGLSTDRVASEAKTAPSKVPGGNYAMSKESGIRQSYSDSFSNDLQEFRGFTLSFTDSIMSVGSLSKRFSDIPKGR